MPESSLAGTMWPSGDVIPPGADPNDFESHGGIRYRKSADPKRTPTLDIPQQSATSGTEPDPIAVRLSTLHQAPVMSAKMVFPLIGMQGLNPGPVGPRSDMVRPGEAGRGFTVFAPDGRRISLSDLRGKPFVLFMVRVQSAQMFCPVCLPALDQMNAARADFERRGVEVMVVASTTVEHCREFADALGLNFPLYADPDWSVFRAFGSGRLGSLPLHAWALLDSRGVVRWVWRFHGDDPEAALPMPSLVMDKVHEVVLR